MKLAVNKSLLRIVVIGALLSVCFSSPARADNEKVAVCAVCGPSQDAPADTVEAITVYEGKTYRFCSDVCRDEFLKTPRRFLGSDLGQPAPAFTLKDVGGANSSLAAYKGKVVLLDMWATFCAYCVGDLPNLQSLHDKYGPKGFTVIGVTADSDVKAIRRITKTAKVTYPVLRGTPPVLESYKVVRLPTLILVGRDGRILKRYGPSADKKTIIADIEQALNTEVVKEKPDTTYASKPEG